MTITRKIVFDELTYIDRYNIILLFINTILTIQFIFDFFL